MCQLLLSGVGYVPTPNVHSDVWNRVESYTIHMLLACRLKITFTFSLKLIIAFFSTITTPSITFANSHFFSGQSTPLPLWSCCISGLGPTGVLQEMMPQRHGWGWYPPQTTSYIHSRHIKSVWDIGMLSQMHMVAPLYRYTGQVSPRFGHSSSLEECKWCHIMFEADIHLRLLHTSILDIYKLFESFVCSLKGIWLHPCTVTPYKLAPDLGSQVHLRSGSDTVTWWLRLISTSDCLIHP